MPPSRRLCCSRKRGEHNCAIVGEGRTALLKGGAQGEGANLGLSQYLHFASFKSCRVFW